uniref:Quinone oxidoreductase-like protein 2 n=1 Tax=Tetraselmis sp. GSL018 TaxID=582737 RepID=A0A061S5S8_9CHLO
MSVLSVVCTALGDPGKGASLPRLETQLLERIKLKSDQVRIRVASSSVNFADVLQLRGLYQEKLEPPFVPGKEVSGEVIEVGEKVTQFSPGSFVVAVCSSGAFAEECVAPASSCFPLPRGVDVREASAIPIAFGTAHLALVERAKLRPGQVVLVLGAGGGVGLAAVQIAKLLGARVVAVARGGTKGKAVKQFGADHWIDSETEGINLQVEVKKAAPAGVDVLFDTVGGQATHESIRCLRWGAQVLLIGFASGNIPSIAANIALVKNITLHGVYWGMYLSKAPEVVRESLREVLAWAAEGRLRVPICRSFPLEDARLALGVLHSREAVGKVILRPSAEMQPRL